MSDLPHSRHYRHARQCDARPALCSAMTQLQEVIIKGGVSIELHAVIRSSDGSRREIWAAPGESVEAFRERIRAEARAGNAEVVIFGGLPTGA
jgi:hypothetical protein